MGIPNLGSSSETIAFCVCPCSDIRVCVLASIPLCSFILFLSLVLLMNNDLIADCGVKCQLSVCLYETCHFDRTVFFLHHFTASPFVFVKVFICFQCGRSPHQEPLRKLIDHPHFSCCATDMCSIYHSIIPVSIAMMDCICAYLYF